MRAFSSVSAHYWKTITQENISAKFYWIPAGGRIESSIQAHIIRVAHTRNILDLRIWEVGVPKPIIHHIAVIPFKVK